MVCMWTLRSQKDADACKETIQLFDPDDDKVDDASQDEIENENADEF